MIIYPCKQGTQEWLNIRAGIPTASCFDEIMTAGKAKSKSRHKYMNHLIGERMLGMPVDGFKSKYMDQGNQFEDRAIASYQEEHGFCEVEKIGFVTTNDGRIGCSPDRFIVGSNGMVQAKAPGRVDIHVSYLRAAAGASDEYKVQIQGEMWICEKDFNEVVSYYPKLPDAVFKMERDDDFIKELAAHVRAFSCQLEDLAEDFKARGWIKEKVAEKIDERGFLTQEDADWAKGLSYE